MSVLTTLVSIALCFDLDTTCIMNSHCKHTELYPKIPNFREPSWNTFSRKGFLITHVSRELRFSNIDSVTATVLSYHCCELPGSLYKSLLDSFCRADDELKVTQ